MSGGWQALEKSVDADLGEIDLMLAVEPIQPGARPSQQTGNDCVFAVCSQT